MNEFLQAIDDILTLAGYADPKIEEIPGRSPTLQEISADTMRTIARQLTDNFLNNPFHEYLSRRAAEIQRREQEEYNNHVRQINQDIRRRRNT